MANAFCLNWSNRVYEIETHPDVQTGNGGTMKALFYNLNHLTVKQNRSYKRDRFVYVNIWREKYQTKVVLKEGWSLVRDLFMEVQREILQVDKGRHV